MKILVLMPLNESHSHYAHALYNSLPHEVRENTFIMPAYIDYLLTTKLAENSIYATANALLAAQKVYDQAVEEKRDLLIFGNIDKKYKFDAIFNFQDAEEDLPYQDGRATAMVDLVKNSDIEKIAQDLYTNEDSKMPLHNILATADFLAAYMKTDPHLEEITAEYEDKIREWKDRNNNGNNQA